MNSLKMNINSMRRVNRRIVLNMIRKYPGITRKEISNLTGMDPSTVTKIVTDLLKNGFILENGEKSFPGRGRRGIRLVVNPNAINGLVVAIGVQKSCVGLAKFDGSYELVESFETPQNFFDFIHKISDIIKSFTKDVVGLSFSIPGIVDMKKGIIRNAPHLKWKEMELRRLILETIDNLDPEMIMMDNEAKLCLVAESWFNEKIKGLKNGVYIYQSEGVGGALLINGEVYHGEDYIAGEIGHMIVDPNGKKCHCGNKGCWETLISTEAIVQSYEYAYGELKGDSYNEKFLTLVSMNSKRAKSVLMRMADYVSIGILNILNVIDPQFVLFGGMMYSLPNYLIERIESTVKSQVLIPDMMKTKILKASMDIDEARIKGGALILINKYIEKNI